MNIMYDLVPVIAWLVLCLVYLYHMCAWRKNEYVIRERNYYHLTQFLLVVQAFAGFYGHGEIMRARSLTWIVAFAGCVLCFAGLSLCLWARIVLGRFWDMHASIQVQHQLVCDGPYRVSRNPLFLGQLLLFLGTGLAWCNVVALLCSVPALWSFKRRIAKEEYCLQRFFTCEYEKYQSSTPRFFSLPRLSHKQHRCVERNAVLYLK
jgi:protein-S-isoprenylcysteine O-methyltransferase